MPQMRLSFRNPLNSPPLEQFYFTDDLWTAIAGDETITRQASAIASTDSVSPIMRIVTTGTDDSGAYKDYTVEGGDLVWVTFISLEVSERITIEAYDQTNGVSIDSQAGSVSAAGTIFFAFTVPATCTTVRMKITTSQAKTIDIDNFAFCRNALIVNPGDLLPNPNVIGGVGQVLDGDRVRYRMTTHRSFQLNFNYVSDAMYERLWEMYQSSDILFFDDGDVPELIELFTYYDTVTMNLAGITNPAGVDDDGVAATAAQSTLPVLYTDPVGAGATPATEISTINYTNVGTDDGNALTTSDPADTFYLYHKFSFSDEDWDRENVQRLEIVVKAEAVDSSPAAIHGCVLYAFVWTTDDTPLGWQEIARTTNGNKNTLSWSTTDPDRAQGMLTENQAATSGPDLYLVLRSRAARDGSNALVMSTYYVEITYNDGLDSEQTLTHQIRLPTDTEADDISVKNRTTGATFAETTNYTVRDGVTLPTNIVTFTGTGISQGDVIETAYNRWHEVRIAYMPDKRQFDSLSSEIRRQMTIVLETIKGEE
jgi:hypothetical protein